MGKLEEARKNWPVDKNGYPFTYTHAEYSVLERRITELEDALYEAIKDMESCIEDENHSIESYRNILRRG